MYIIPNYGPSAGKEVFMRIDVARELIRQGRATAAVPEVHIPVAVEAPVVEVPVTPAIPEGVIPSTEVKRRGRPPLVR